MSIFIQSGSWVLGTARIAAVMVALGGISGIGDAHAASGSDGDETEAKADALPDPTKSASNPLSDAGTSGFHLYRRHCQSCHGYLGAGSKEAGPLTKTRYSQQHAAREEFHRAFRNSTRDHNKVARGSRKHPGPKFNQIELIGKFLREIDAWHAMLATVKTD